VAYAIMRTGDHGIHRVTLHGSTDMGDVAGIHSHGTQGIAEVKNHKDNPSQSQLEGWKREAMAEKDNACADWVMLVVHEKGCNMTDPYSPTFWRNRVYMTLGDVMRMAFGGVRQPLTTYTEQVYAKWLQLTVGDVFDIVTGSFESQPEVEG
jgi:hypothetical protein